MGLTNFPNGATSFGIPLVGNGYYQPRMPGYAGGSLGKIFFVDGSTGVDGNDGSSPSSAFATIQRAIDMARTNRGDTIFVSDVAEYDETVTVDKNDITIIGLSVSGNRTTLKKTGTGSALINSTGQHLMVANMQIRTEDTVAACIQRANGYRFVNCDFISDGGIGLRLLPGNTDPDDSYTASEGILEGCWFRYCADVGLTYENPGPSGGFGGVGTTGVWLIGCRFQGNTNQDIKDVDNAGSNDACFGAAGGEENHIHGCYFISRNKAVYITLTNGGANAGLISGNFFADDAGLNGTKIAIATAIVFSGNFQAAGVVDGSGF